MESRKPKGILRRGWTTGACATAAAAAAYEALTTGRFPNPVTITLPRGEQPQFALAQHALVDGTASAGIIKDAGDDPDVTHEATIIATVAPGQPGTGITFHAGDGVGTVTRPGLVLDVGEPAINPVPRQMMTTAISQLSKKLSGKPDIAITISIPGGEALAEKTTNGRLGIRGGLSILGTTGIVIPYSCASWIHSIQNGIDVARASNIGHVAAATGRTSEEAARKLYGLPEEALIDMGDFVGGTLKYLRRRPVPRLTIAGGIAKISKMAAGHMDLHSSRSSVDIAALAILLADLGAAEETIGQARDAPTALGVVDAAGPLAGALADRVAGHAREVALATLSGDTEVDVIIVDRKGKIMGRA